MKTNLRTFASFAASIVAVSVASHLAAQVLPPGPLPLFAPNATAVTVTLGYNGSGDFALPPAPPISILPGASLKLVTGFDAATIASIQWFKDGVQIGTGNPSFEIASVTANDSGYYSAKLVINGATNPTNKTFIRIAAPTRQQLLNLSSRATISPTSPILISGFVVAASPGQLSESKYLLIRAVGGSLATLGVAHPLASPALRIYNADGSPYQFPFPVPFNPLPASIAVIAARVGAFPLTYNDGARDFALITSFPPGAYTVQVYSTDGGTGDVLLEIYEIPDSALGYP